MRIERAFHLGCAKQCPNALRSQSILPISEAPTVQQRQSQKACNRPQHLSDRWSHQLPQYSVQALPAKIATVALRLAAAGAFAGHGLPGECGHLVRARYTKRTHNHRLTANRVTLHSVWCAGFNPGVPPPSPRRGRPVWPKDQTLRRGTRVWKCSPRQTDWAVDTPTKG